MTETQTPMFPVYDLLSQASCGTKSQESLIRCNSLEVIRLKLCRGNPDSVFDVSTDVLVHCVTGRVTVKLKEGSIQLGPAQLVHLPANTSISIHGVDESVVLIVHLGCVTPALPGVKAAMDHSKAGGKKIDIVQEASEESFPASDPPSRTPLSHA